MQTALDRHVQQFIHSSRTLARYCAPAAKAAAMVAAVAGSQGLIASVVSADISGGSLGTVTSGAKGAWDTVNAILRPVSGIAIVVCGLAAAFGKMEWGTVVKVSIGILIANSATTILDYFSSGTTASG